MFSTVSMRSGRIRLRSSRSNRRLSPRCRKLLITPFRVKRQVSLVNRKTPGDVPTDHWGERKRSSCVKPLASTSPAPSVAHPTDGSPRSPRTSISRMDSQCWVPATCQVLCSISGRRNYLVSAGACARVWSGPGSRRSGTCGTATLITLVATFRSWAGGFPQRFGGRPASRWPSPARVQAAWRPAPWRR